MKLIFSILILFFSFRANAQTTFFIVGKDGVPVTADLYASDTSKQFIILFHQARYSRGEYKETALKLNKMGFNCLAVDLRSGKEVKGIKNETAEVALSRNKATNYLDAEQDMLTAIDYVYQQTNKPMIILGSSYSASLALKIAANNNKIAKVIAFSPGEYFGSEIKIADYTSKINVPTFITSSKKESEGVKKLISENTTGEITHFVPKGEGKHGSSALWDENPNHQEYWLALMLFLK
ncbi:MAG: alpha/beta hydrolase [Bacteroidia bacterium]